MSPLFASLRIPPRDHRVRSIDELRPPRPVRAPKKRGKKPRLERPAPPPTSLIGRAQVSVLRTTTWGRWFRAPNNRVYRVCLRLHARGLLQRDPTDAYLFTASEAGQAAIIAHDDALAAQIELQAKEHP